MGGCFVNIPLLTYLRKQRGITLFIMVVLYDFWSITSAAFIQQFMIPLGKKTQPYIPAFVAPKIAVWQRNSQLLWWWAPGGNMDRNRERRGWSQTSPASLWFQKPFLNLVMTDFKEFAGYFVVFCLKFLQIMQGNNQAKRRVRYSNW